MERLILEKNQNKGLSDGTIINPMNIFNRQTSSEQNGIVNNGTTIDLEDFTDNGYERPEVSFIFGLTTFFFIIHEINF